MPMCLAVPGQVLERRGDLAQVDFQGNRLEISLTLTPDAQPGDWVLVHAGFAIGTLDEAEARETWGYLREAGITGVEGAPP
jgi:hydrogenase expression/formation protein HypC